MINRPLPRLDANPDIRASLLKHCRLQRGEVWQDTEGKRRVGCLDAASRTDARRLMGGARRTGSALQRSGVWAAQNRRIHRLAQSAWVANTDWALLENASLYVWVGADQKTDFQPLPDFMIMMRETPFRSRSLITMRNRRGYGAQRNWMAVRQELLYYTKGAPVFNVDAEYTDIPKILRGYYKKVNGRLAENTERGKSETIRAGNAAIRAIALANPRVCALYLLA